MKEEEPHTPVPEIHDLAGFLRGVQKRGTNYEGIPWEKLLTYEQRGNLGKLKNRNRKDIQSQLDKD